VEMENKTLIAACPSARRTGFLAVPGRKGPSCPTLRKRSYTYCRALFHTSTSQRAPQKWPSDYRHNNNNNNNNSTDRGSTNGKRKRHIKRGGAQPFLSRFSS
jgi:hypothetical protein